MGKAQAGSSPGECSVILSSEYLNKNHINPEVAPHIRASQRFYHIVPGSTYPDYLTAMSPSGIHFAKTDLGYDFWTGDSIVHIELLSVHDRYGFSRKEFWKTVIESFQLTDS